MEAILDGRQPEEMTLPGLMEPFPVEWEEQENRGFASRLLYAPAASGLDAGDRRRR